VSQTVSLLSTIFVFDFFNPFLSYQHIYSTSLPFLHGFAVFLFLFAIKLQNIFRSKVAQVATVAICIRKALTSDPCRDSDRPEVILAFPQFFKANGCKVPRIRPLLLHSVSLSPTQSFGAAQTGYDIGL
jgi:hypothetical protein